jgi:hypothetical protein
MHSNKIIGLAIALFTVLAVPAQAATTASECSVASMNGNFTPAQALSALNAQMGGAGGLNTASDADVLAAFGKAVAADKSITVALASVIAAGRPDLVEQLNAQVAQLCSGSSQALLEMIEQAANEPTPDQLAAIANEIGAAPAAGFVGADGSP